MSDKPAIGFIPLPDGQIAIQVIDQSTGKRSTTALSPESAIKAALMLLSCAQKQTQGQPYASTERVPTFAPTRVDVVLHQGGSETVVLAVHAGGVNFGVSLPSPKALAESILLVSPREGTA